MELINEYEPNLTIPEIFNSIKIAKILDNHRKNHRENVKLIFYIIEYGKLEKNNDFENQRKLLYKKYNITY